MPYSPPSSVRIPSYSPRTLAIPDFSPLSRASLQLEPEQCVSSSSGSSRNSTPKEESGLRFGDNDRDGTNGNGKRVRRHIRSSSVDVPTSSFIFVQPATSNKPPSPPTSPPLSSASIKKDQPPSPTRRLFPASGKSEEGERQRQMRLYGPGGIRKDSGSPIKKFEIGESLKEESGESDEGKKVDGEPKVEEEEDSSTIPFPSVGSPPLNPTTTFGGVVPKIPFPLSKTASSSQDSSGRLRSNSGHLKLELESTKNPLNVVVPPVGSRASSPMIRKKSGELVKSSLKNSNSAGDRSRAKSAPSTPVGPKAVHFDSNLEHIKLFLAQQKPTAVSRDGSPVDTETEEESEYPFGNGGKNELVCILSNFPSQSSQRENSEVFLESLVLVEGKSLKGIVMVKNMSFQKWVAVRFTFDNWQTISEVSAEYYDSVRNGQYDRFSFYIKLQDMARIEDKTLFLCVRFTVEGKEYWDSNGGGNYQVKFLRRFRNNNAQKVPGKSNMSSPARQDELRKELDRLVSEDDSDGYSCAPKIPWRTTKSQSSNNLANRYDFGTSLKNFSRPSSSILKNPYFASGSGDSPKSSSITTYPLNNNNVLNQSVSPPNSNQTSPIATPGVGERERSYTISLPPSMGFRDGMPVTDFGGRGGEDMMEGRKGVLPPTVFSPNSPFPSHEESWGYDNSSMGYFGSNFQEYPYRTMYGNIQRPPSPPEDEPKNLKDEDRRYYSFPPLTASNYLPLPLPSLIKPTPDNFNRPPSPEKSPESGSPPKTDSPTITASTVSNDSNGSPLQHEIMLTSPSDLNGSLGSSPDTNVRTPPSPPKSPLMESGEKERPPMSSPAYYDFVDKFCFYNSGSALGLTTTIGENKSNGYSSPKKGSPPNSRTTTGLNFYGGSGNNVSNSSPRSSSPTHFSSTFPAPSPLSLSGAANPIAMMTSS